ncbi:MAG: glycosyltransferase family 39 protein [Phycisphaerales bacterium]|nr:glycosyltransferase family 39 protein [Phycisphaerales bacterium]
MQDSETPGLDSADPARRDDAGSRTAWTRFHRFWFRRDSLFVLVLALYASFFGLATTEMEFHEIFVVQTAAEMQERGDYLVPHFNGELRLTKPPMNYWLTAACAWVRGADRPEAIDGRLPSALAGVALVVITILLGNELWSRAVGLSAGLILCGTFGFVKHTHSARPEMVYAALCAGAFLCFVAAWRRRGRSRLPWLGWVLVALAILTKGPQFPALMLGSLALGLALHAPSRRHIARVFRPVRGLLIVAVLSSWWWFAIRAAVGDETLADSQLLGSRFLLGFDAWHNPAYFYLIWALLLPWIFLFGPMLRAAVNRGSRRAAAARIMAIVVLGTILVLNFGHDKRPHYLLPILPIASLLMALGLRGLFKRLSVRCGQRCVRTLVLVTASIAVAGVLAARFLLPPDAREPHLDMLLAVNLLAIVAATGLVLRSNLLPQAISPFRVPLALRWAGVVAVALSSSLLLTYLLTSTNLPPRRHTAEMVARVPKDAVLVTIGVEPHYIIHYAGRRVVSPETVDKFLAMKLDSAWIVTDETSARELAHHGSKREIDRIPDCEGEIDWVLGYWQAAPAPAEP